MMKELIYNQTEIPEKQWRYGLRSSAAVGCGWIAVYNALLLMGYRSEPEELIRYFERMVPVIHGNMGTTLLGPTICMKQVGFSTKVSADVQEFDELAKQGDVCILFYRWVKPWKYGAHFVTLEYRDGEFWGYNTYTNSKGPDRYGKSLREFLKKKKYFGAVLTAIYK